MNTDRNGMYPCFDVEGISAERLLQEWRWLVQGRFRLFAVNAFGDLFLEDETGCAHRLDITSATLSAISDSERDFKKAAGDPGKRREWFLEDLARQAEERGFRPGKGQCVGYKIPAVFKESAGAPDNLYVADLYEFVSLMGDLHGQMSDVPDGGKVRINVQRKPNQAD